MNTVTEKQAALIRSLAVRFEAHKVVAPKKVTRWNDPVGAHTSALRYVREVIALLDAGNMTKGAASTHIGQLLFKAKAL